MDRPCKPDGAHQHEKHHHGSHRANANMENEVDAAHDAWTAWKSNDPSAWEAALDLKERINPRAWRQAMREVDKEEAANKKPDTHDVLPPVTINNHEQLKLGPVGDSVSAVPNDRNYYAGSQVPRYYSAPTEQRYYPQKQQQSYSWQPDNEYRIIYPQDGDASQYNQQRAAIYYPQTYGYQYNQQRAANYYPQDYGYQYNQQRQANYYPQTYGYGSQQSNWIGPAIGGGAGALFDQHNRWRGTVLGGIVGTVIQSVSRSGFGSGYGGFGSGYGGNGLFS